jgi:superfamily II DNA or RNA helicase
MPNGIYENIECDIGKHPKFTAQAHQAELTDYFLNKLKYKGVVAYHRLGSGKSCSSILISDGMIRASKVKKVYVLTPGSLRQNFIEEYCEKCGYKPSYLKKYYTFITTNYSVGERLPNFKDSFVIIDEVHNLINGVKNQSKHATLIYNALMKSDCKILALTGTPVFNFIWEWPFLGNLLKPGVFPKMFKKEEFKKSGNKGELNKGELDIEAFMTKFIVDNNGNVKPVKPENFKAQMKGIVSYFPGVSGGFYPEVIYEKPVQIRMTPIQDASYWAIASWESDIRMKGPPKKILLRTNPTEYNDKMEEFIMASKYIMSRFYSNFYYPESEVGLNFRSAKDPGTRDEVHHIGKVLKYKYKPTGEIGLSIKYFVNTLYNYELQRKKMEKKDISKEELKGISKKIMKQVKDDVKKNITTEYQTQNIGWIEKSRFSNHKLVDVYSRKMVAVITNVISHWKSKHVIFTFFKNKAGVNMLHSLFKMCGIYTEIYSGDISDTKRRNILKNFNAEKNRYGDNIKILLVTEAGAEGINILEAQHMHILESSTREMKIQQAIGRVVRYKSHMVDGRKPMPKNEQVVHIWRYWSTSEPEPFTLNRTYKDSEGNEKKSVKVIVDKTTVDEILYKKGVYNVNTIKSFLDLFKSVSVTKYDKSQDKDTRLVDYGILPVSTKLLEAYEVSNKRYENNKYNITQEISINTSQLIKDANDSVEEEIKEDVEE